MKISHELPLGLMHHGYEWNDYDYCLPHLIDKYDQYRLYFQKARLDKRFIIMDNGLFEGVTHTTEDLIDKINLIHPSIFIVPDAWNDSTTTVRNAKHWMLNYQSYLPVDTNLMAVCQGKDIGELVTTYQILVDLGYKHIAFNHSSIAYTNYYPNHSKLFAQMYGRIELIRRLIETGIVRKALYHHLLGVALPQEMLAYGEFDWIKSVDTSNPIIVGYKGVRYEDNGIEFKPSEKIEELNEVDLSNQIEDIIFNINKFKGYARKNVIAV
jgi:hypothetical protein